MLIVNIPDRRFRPPSLRPPNLHFRGSSMVVGISETKFHLILYQIQLSISPHNVKYLINFSEFFFRFLSTLFLQFMEIL